MIAACSHQAMRAIADLHAVVNSQGRRAAMIAACSQHMMRAYIQQMMRARAELHAGVCMQEFAFGVCIRGALRQNAATFRLFFNQAGSMLSSCEQQNMHAPLVACTIVSLSAT